MSSEKRDAFTFYRSYYEAAKELSDKHRLALYDAIIGYGIDDIEADLTSIPKSLFILIKPILDKSKTNAKSGASGGKANAKRNTSESEADAKRTVSETETNVKQTLSNKSDDKDINKDKDKDINKNINNTPEPPSDEGGDGGDIPKTQNERFVIFWDAYPKKIGKGEAEKAWKKANPNIDLFNKILEAIEKAKKSKEWDKDNGQFIPKPATWLNQKRWDDELTPLTANLTGGEAGERAITSNPDNGRFRDALADGESK